MGKEIEIDVKALVRYLTKHLTTIMLTTVIAMVAAFGVTNYVMAPVYESQSMIYITSGASGGSVVQNMLSSIQAGSALTADYKTLATSKPVLEQVIRELDLDTTYEELKEQVSTENPDNTRILTLKVRDHDPAQAKRIVDRLTRIERDKIADVMSTSRPNIMQWGDIQNEPVSTSPLKAALCAGLAVLLLTLIFMTVRFIRNDTINSPEDIEKALDLRTLAEIPLISKKGAEKKNNKKRGLR